MGSSAKDRDGHAPSTVPASVDITSVRVTRTSSALHVVFTSSRRISDRFDDVAGVGFALLIWRSGEEEPIDAVGDASPAPRGFGLPRG